MTRRPRGRRWVGAGLIGRVGLIGLGLTLLAILGLIWSVNGPGPSPADRTVFLKRGSGLAGIAATLGEAGVISSPGLFSAAARLAGAGSQLKAGEYRFARGVSLARVLADIRAGRVVRHRLSIPEGWTSGMALDALAARPELTGVAVEPPEGSLLPDTYDLQRGEARTAVVRRMREARDRLLADLWAHRQPGLPLASPAAAVTLASIVEKETGIAAERPRVAAVFINRLRAGMPLQSDPTIIYGLTRGRPLGRGIRASELAAQTPYNTYRVAGLPPTPIANPGRAALAAVLNPPATRELYFVADGTGGHVFAQTYAAHQANVARWRTLEAGRGR